MAILLYDYLELEERAGRYLKIWKAWHIVIFACAAIFGMLNYIFLQNTMYMVGDRCVLVAPTIVFENITIFVPNGEGGEVNEAVINVVNNETEEIESSEAQTTTVAVPSDTSTAPGKTKRELKSGGVYAPKFRNETVKMKDGNGHLEDREVLDLMRTFFGSSQDCEFAEYMPILATVFALVWTTLFVMCPGGGRSRSGLTQPWRVLAPALLFALVLVGLTGHSFTSTNRGLRDFCAAFYNYTNATTCSSVNVYLERSWNATWKFGSRAEATRAASAGLWVCWAGAATLMIVRCLAAPDFQLMRTGVYLTKDPEQRVTPYLRKSRRRRAAAASVSPSPNKSVRSEPTATTELVTASVESEPSSRTVTPEPKNESISRV